MKSALRYSKLITAVAIGAAMSGAAFGQQAPDKITPAAGPQQDKVGDKDIVIVTGTRQTGLTAADSPAPIQVLDIGTLDKHRPA